MRLDKFLAHTTGYSRTDVKKILKQKKVSVDGIIVTSPNQHIDELKNFITFNGEDLFYQKFVYLMMNKPSGYLSATKDGENKTVIDLIDPYYKRFELSIAGRLDKDTEGLLILTNDGQFLHEIISPKKEIYKTYIAQITGELSAEAIVQLENGVQILDGNNNYFTTAPARLKKLNNTEIELQICEGKFHQVKRMFASVGCKVIGLKRVAIGQLLLDNFLELGEYRELEESECYEIKKST